MVTVIFYYCPPQPSTLEANKNVEVFWYGCSASHCIVQFVGRQGQTRKWGELTIGEGKEIIQITRVLVNGVRPPFMLFKKVHMNNPKEKCNSDTTTLRTVFDTIDPPLIAVCTSSIVVKLDQQEQQEN